MKKNQRYLAMHKFSIKETSDGRWRTYLPDENGKTGKEIRRATKEELENYLISYYKEKEKADQITFKECYEEWCIYHHRKKNNGDNTRYKYQTDYNRFLKDTDFESMAIAEITDTIIDSFLIDSIYGNGHITYKTFGRLYGYLSGTFKRARRLRIISENPMDYLEKKEYYETCKKPKPKTAKSELITDKHFELLLEQLYSDMDKYPEYLVPYAVELGALTGMRVAELAALQWSDVDYISGTITIVRSDKFNRLKNEWFVADETKTRKIRQFPIDESIERSLKRLKKVQMETGQVSDWLFPHKEFGWTHSNLISSYLKNKCKQIGLERTYGVHAFRKTLNSGMRSDGASALMCSGMLGNSIEVNNRYYSYDSSNMEEKRSRVAGEHAKRNFR